MPVAAVIVAFVVCCAPPILTTAFDQDETRQLQLLGGGPGRVDSGMTQLELWSFFDGRDEGRLERAVYEGREPWCRAAEGEGPPPKMRFFRPLASATLIVDHALFGLDPFGYHLQSLLWFVVLLGILGALFHRLLTETPPGAFWRPTLASGALYLFAFDPAHAETLGRVATRHLLVASVFGMAALLVHVVTRQRRILSGPWLAAGGLVLAYLASETALQVVPYIVCYEIWRSDEPAGIRLRAALPALGLTSAYVAAYVLAGYGAHGIDYLDPLTTPLGVLAREVPLRFADLTLEQLLGLRSWLGVRDTPWRLTRLALPAAGRILLALGVVAVVGGLLWLATRDLSAARRRAIRALAAAAPLALVPSLLGQPGTRQLFIPGVGFAVAVAALIGAGWGSLTAPGARRGRAALGLAAVILAIVHGLLAPFALSVQLGRVREATRMVTELWRLPPGSAPASNGGSADSGERIEDVVVLAAPSTSVPYPLFPELRVIVGPGGRIRRTPDQDWWYLSNTTHDFRHEWLRVGPRHFELHLGRPKAEIPYTRTLWFGCEGVPGLVVDTRLMRIRVLETDESGGILRIGVELARAPEDPSLLFASWRDGALRPVPVPVVGEGLVLD